MARRRVATDGKALCQDNFFTSHHDDVDFEVVDGLGLGSFVTDESFGDVKPPSDPGSYADGGMGEFDRFSDHEQSLGGLSSDLDDDDHHEPSPQ